MSRNIRGLVDGLLTGCLFLGAFATLIADIDAELAARITQMGTAGRTTALNA